MALKIRLLAPAAFFALFPAAAVGGGLAIAPLATVAGVIAARPGGWLQTISRHRIFLILLTGFVAWATLSTLWSPYPDHRQALRLIATALGAILFVGAAGADASARRLTLAAGSAGLLVLAGLLLGEALANMPFTRADQGQGLADWVLQRNPGRGVSLLVILVWGVMGGFIQRGGAVRWGLAILLLVATGFLTTQFGMAANIAAFGFGLCAFVLGLAAPRLGILLTSSLAVVFVALAPFVLPDLVRSPELVSKLPDSWAERTQVWAFTSDRIREQPWIGHGLDSSRSFHDMINVRGQFVHAIPLHPHSASLQIWLETGAVGAMLAIAVLIVGAFSMAGALRHKPAAAAAACGTLASMMLIANVSYGAWQEWWDATAFIAAALVAAIATSAKE